MTSRVAARACRARAAEPLGLMESEMSEKDNPMRYRGLPVVGYKPTQSGEAIDLVNEGKILEERVLRWFEKVKDRTEPGEPGFDVAGIGLGFAIVGMGQVQIGFMLGYRAVFQPNGSRIALPEDAMDVRDTGGMTEAEHMENIEAAEERAGGYACDAED